MERKETSFADKIIEFNKQLYYEDALPQGFKVMNPYRDNPETIKVMDRFYHKFYNDNKPRKFMIGINPSRHGAGITGVPFTDTKRLKSACGIEMKSASTHEVSSVFMYEMIDQYGGVERFYKDCYINSPFPLAIVRETKNGTTVNANYYDDQKLYDMTQNFMIESLKTQIDFGLISSEVYVLGVKNAVFIDKLNKKAKLFDRLVVLEHPRFIQQYKSRDKQIYIDKYIMRLAGY